MKKSSDLCSALTCPSHQKIIVIDVGIVKSERDGASFHAEFEEAQTYRIKKGKKAQINQFKVIC